MPEPNPLLGLHVAPGAVAWAQVLRKSDGSFRVLQWAVERASDDPTVAVARAVEVTARRAFRGRGAFVALPDGSGCLVTAAMPPEELDLAGDDLKRELHEYTPFEPDSASLRFRLARTEARRREFVVAALPAAQERRFLDAAASHDDGSVGYGFAGASLVRGARAAGLVGPTGFLVELLPRTTHVYALDDVRVRRYLVAGGADDVVAAAAKALGRDPADVLRQVETGTADGATQSALDTAADAVADDVRSAARYHVAQRYAPKDPPEGVEMPPFVAAGPLLVRAPLRRALGAHLGPEFADPPRRDPAASIEWDRPPGPDLAAVAGALGAALEAFEPPDARLALRHPPREVEPPRESRLWIWAAGLLFASLAAAIAWLAVTTPTSSPAARTRTGEPAPRTATAPPEATAAAPRLAVQTVADGGVRVAWTGGTPGAVWRLERRDPAADVWTDVGTVSASDTGGATVDHPVGASGTYRWRLVAASADVPDGDEAVLDRRVDVQVRFAGVEPDGRARFELERTWRGKRVVAQTVVAVGDALVAQRPVDGAPAAVVLDPGCTLVAMRPRDEEEVVRVDVPDFGADGTVVRAPDGTVPTTPRDVVRTVRRHDATLSFAPDGRRVTVSRKMTDG